MTSEASPSAAGTYPSTLAHADKQETDIGCAARYTQLARSTRSESTAAQTATAATSCAEAPCSNHAPSPPAPDSHLPPKWLDRLPPSLPVPSQDPLPASPRRLRYCAR